MSSGQAILAVEAVAGEKLSGGTISEWTELTYQQIMAATPRSSSPPMRVFVFLTHSAEYESWSLPLAIILIVPMSLLCSLAGTYARGMDNNLFTQIGFVVLAGLACKNAVLIVEFAASSKTRARGPTVSRRRVAASKLRLRPILMTSFAFILGVLPLVLSTGAGARNAPDLGTGVFFRHVGSDGLRRLLTPVFY